MSHSTQTDHSFERFGVMSGPAERTVGFYLPDTFGMLPFISALEPLRAANRFSGRALYDWVLMGHGDTKAIANNAMAMAVDHSVFEPSKLDRLIVCGPHEPHLFDNPRVLRSLRQWSSQGTQMGSLDTGTYLLAQADLIQKRRCTIHWENLPGFREAFPELTVTSELYEIDTDLFTCAGGTASLDMMLALIRQDHGNVLADKIAELFLTTVTRKASDPQRRSVVERTGIYHPGLATCIELMEANLEQPLRTTELAQMVNVSSRQLGRLFRTYLGTTPTLYYQQLRLKAGLQLLRQTTMSVAEIATSVGFSSADYFSRRFRVEYGHPPTDERRRDDMHDEG